MEQWILHASVGRACRPTAARADLVGDGPLPGFLQQGSVARSRLHLVGRLLAPVLGSLFRADGPEQPDLDGVEMAAWWCQQSYGWRCGRSAQRDQGEALCRAVLARYVFPS